MALTGDITVPGGGKVPKKAAAAGLVIVLALTGVYYYKQRKAAAAPATAAAAATSTSQYPPDGTTGNPADPYSTDPASGQTYGNEAAGSGGTLGAFGSGAASGMYYDPNTGAYDLTSPFGTGGTGVSSGNPQTPGGPPFASNAAWSNWVIQEIQAVNPGINTGDLINALGLYLDGQPVSVAQKTLVLDATAIGGNPPAAGANGYPPKVRLDGGKGGGGGTVKVPAVTGKTYAAAAVIIAGAHLVPRRGEKDVGTVTSQSPAAGATADTGATVTLSGKGAGGGAKVPRRVITSTGAFDLHTLAVQNGVTEAQLAKANPKLAGYSGSGRHIPKGVQITIPAH